MNVYLEFWHWKVNQLTHDFSRGIAGTFAIRTNLDTKLKLQKSLQSRRTKATLNGHIMTDEKHEPLTGSLAKYGVT